MVTDSDIDRFFDLLNEQAKRTFKDLDQDELAALPNIFTQFATKTGGDPAYVQEPLIGCLKGVNRFVKAGPEPYVEESFIIFSVWREIFTLRNGKFHT